MESWAQANQLIGSVLLLLTYNFAEYEGAVIVDN